jgi:hypothetical protein
MGNSVDPISILEQLKRKQLYNPNFGAGSVTQSQEQDPVQSQESPPQGSPPQQPQPQQTQQTLPTQNPQQSQARVQVPAQSPRDQALAQYRQAMQVPAPSQADYHPSVMRRIAAGLLGGVAGLSDPKTGYQVGHGVAYGPYDRKLTDYQKNLAQKKEAFETEEDAELGKAKTEEQLAQKNAEEKRAGSEEANRKVKEFEISPAGQEAKLKLAHVEHPDKLPVPYELELTNGEKIVGYEGSNGQFKDSENNIYGADSIKSARKVGSTSSKTGDTTTKPPREGEAGAIDQWTQEHNGRAPNYSERLNIHRQYADKPEGDFKQEIQLGNARLAANRNYQTQLNQASSHLDKLDQVKLLITNSTPESLAVAVPNVLTALISGQGTGVRITQAEINQILHARGLGDSVEAFVNKISGQGSLSATQKKDISSMIDDVKGKVSQKQKDLSDTMDEIDNAKNPDDISKAHIKYRKGLTGGASQGTKVTEGTKPKTKEDFLKLLGDK